MGYTTEFKGKFDLNKPLDEKLKTYLNKFSEVRHMKRNIKGFGCEGEFFVYGTGFAGQDNDDTVIDQNLPPSSQPELWCSWVPSDDGKAIEWNGAEKFYGYSKWLIYLMDKFLYPAGYELSGVVEYQGEDAEDCGVIRVVDGVVIKDADAGGSKKYYSRTALLLKAETETLTENEMVTLGELICDDPHPEVFDIKTMYKQEVAA